MHRKLVLGVDGGATKTICVISDEDFRVVGVGKAGPCNYNVVGVENARRNVEKAIQMAYSSISDGQLKGKVADVGCFGIGGLTTQRDYEIISSKIVPLESARNRVIVNDVVVAFYAATGGEPGIVVVAGTGSIAYGMNSRGESMISSGWGWLIGDEGSAFYIARQALASATKAYDGRGRKTILVDMFREEFGVSDFKDIVPKIYHEVTSTNIALLSRVVFSAARRGDRVAMKILRDAGEELGKAAVAIARRLFNKGERIVVGVSGGVFRADLTVWEHFKKYVSKRLPNVIFTPPVEHPVVGALIMGYKALNLEISDEDKLSLMENVAREIGE
ncbi:MAG: BadF/BadG/BcrA/BcrD ATPase family protein [Candidatus Bathyarchaeia archaeon]